MSETLGTGFRPNYAVGDFNRDKKTDFAVLLSRPGKPKNLNPEDGSQSSEHFPDFPMALVVFNGGPWLNAQASLYDGFFTARALRSSNLTKVGGDFTSGSLRRIRTPFL
jgi:hypothetical protein